MDGLKGKLINSLQYKLSLWLCFAILIFALAAGAFSFLALFEEANELQDDQLSQIAALFNARVTQVTTLDSGQSVDFNPEFRVLVQIMSPSGTDVLGIPSSPLVLPQDVDEGIQTVTVARVPWRILVKTLGPQQRLVVAQKISLRDEMASESAISALAPYVILIPVLLFIVGYLIRQMFKPVTQLAKELDQRAEQDLRAINQADLPSEIQPFVAAINRMLLRLDDSVKQQRRFIADAAHEMRTPLTALSLQMESLEASEISEQARQRLMSAKSGLQRTRLLLNQLLALARAQQDSVYENSEVSVLQIFRIVLEDLLPLADAKNIDIGVTSESDPILMTRELDLVALLKNLVDNAIRYTPSGGKVDLLVRTENKKVIVQIDDSGPGIAPEERERVFDAFYRVLGNDENGSGLGLSIVKTIAERIGAVITLENIDEAKGSGLRVSVSIPL